MLFRLTCFLCAQSKYLDSNSLSLSQYCSVLQNWYILKNLKYSNFWREFLTDFRRQHWEDEISVEDSGDGQCWILQDAVWRYIHRWDYWFSDLKLVMWGMISSHLAWPYLPRPCLSEQCNVCPAESAQCAGPGAQCWSNHSLQSPANTYTRRRNQLTKWQSEVNEFLAISP